MRKGVISINRRADTQPPPATHTLLHHPGHPPLCEEWFCATSLVFRSWSFSLSLKSPGSTPAGFTLTGTGSCLVCVERGQRCSAAVKGQEGAGAATDTIWRWSQRKLSRGIGGRLQVNPTRGQQWSRNAWIATQAAWRVVWGIITPCVKPCTTSKI